MNKTICFIDGVHPTHNVQPAYGWIKKGIRKEISANSGRARLNLSGAVDIVSHRVIVQEDKTLNADAADATISFFGKIEKAYPDKEIIHVFCDNGILNGCFEVMKELGPGFLVNVYKNVLVIAMKQKGLQVKRSFEIVFRQSDRSV